MLLWNFNDVGKLFSMWMWSGKEISSRQFFLLICLKGAFFAAIKTFHFIFLISRHETLNIKENCLHNTFMYASNRSHVALSCYCRRQRDNKFCRMGNWCRRKIEKFVIFDTFKWKFFKLSSVSTSDTTSNCQNLSNSSLFPQRVSSIIHNRHRKSFFRTFGNFSSFPLTPPHPLIDKPKLSSMIQPWCLLNYTWCCCCFGNE